MLHRILPQADDKLLSMWKVCNPCANQGGRVVKALDLRSNVRMHTWVRTPFLVVWDPALPFLFYFSENIDSVDVERTRINTNLGLWWTHIHCLLHPYNNVVCYVAVDPSHGMPFRSTSGSSCGRARVSLNRSSPSGSTTAA